MIFKKRKQREQPTSELSERQKEILLTGESNKAGRGFITENERLGAWTEHRANLMCEGGPRRPHAYRRFEIDADRPPYVDHVHQLFNGGLFKPHELTWLEDRYITLSPDQPASLHKEFETVDGIRGLALPTAALEKIAREFGMAEAFHRFRGRPTLAERYKSLGGAIRKVLAEELQPAISEKGVYKCD